MRGALLWAFLAWIIGGAATSSPLSPSAHDAIAQAIHNAIDAQRTPGAVVLVAQNGKILLHEAYGRRAITPQPEDMTRDTIFDMASLTKPIVTPPAC